MKFEFQLNSNDYEEASLAELERASQAERRTIHNLALLIGLFFLLMGIMSKENGFLVVGVVLVFMPVLCKIFVKTGVEIEMPIANSTNYGEPMTMEMIGEGLALNTSSWQGIFTWEAFRFFIETRKLLVIYPMSSLYPVSYSKFIIVPKRAFSGEEQLWDFR
ncbi:MAG: YcxB family protein [Microcoleus sp.]